MPCCMRHRDESSHLGRGRSSSQGCARYGRGVGRGAGLGGEAHTEKRPGNEVWIWGGHRHGTGVDPGLGSPDTGGVAPGCTCCGAGSCLTGSWAVADAGAEGGRVAAGAGSACGSRPRSGRCPRSELASPGTVQVPRLECRLGVNQACPPGLGLTGRPLPPPPRPTPTCTHPQPRRPCSSHRALPLAPSLSSSSPSSQEPGAGTAPRGAGCLRGARVSAGTRSCCSLPTSPMGAWGGSQPCRQGGNPDSKDSVNRAGPGNGGTCLFASPSWARGISRATY